MIYRLNGVVFDITKAQTVATGTYAPGDLLKDVNRWAENGITAEADPVYPDSHLFTWVYDYTPYSNPAIIITPRDPQVIADEDAVAAQEAQDSVDSSEVKTLPAINYLATHTNAEIVTYIKAAVNTEATRTLITGITTANLTNLKAGLNAINNEVEALRDLMTKLALAEAVDIRRRFR